MSKFTIFLSKILPVEAEKNLRWLRDKYLRHYKIEKLPDEMWDESMQTHSISFCITCMNRLYQLKKTLEKNIQSNKDYPNFEFVVLNYNSQDNLDEWARASLKKYIEAGVVNYYHTKEPTFFHACKAKNLAHKLATGNYVCNLDGDNYTGDHYARYINYLFNKDSLNHVYHFYRKPLWGTTGRIVMSRENFHKLGGYDETFLPQGFQDWDLVLRAKAMGMTTERVEIDNFLKYESNTTFEKTLNYKNELHFEGQYDNWSDMNNMNVEKSKSNIKTGIFTANEGSSWGVGKVYKNFQKDPIVVD